MYSHNFCSPKLYHPGWWKKNKTTPFYSDILHSLSCPAAARQRAQAASVTQQARNRKPNVRHLRSIVCSRVNKARNCVPERVYQIGSACLPVGSSHMLSRFPYALGRYSQVITFGDSFFFFPQYAANSAAHSPSWQRGWCREEAIALLMRRGSVSRGGRCMRWDVRNLV